MGISQPYKQELAETEALTMLTWLAGQEDVFAEFLAFSGASVDVVAQKVAKPEFLASVVDFMMTDDAHILAWAQDVGRKPETVLLIRAGLPGGDHWNWT